MRERRFPWVVVTIDAVTLVAMMLAWWNASAAVRVSDQFPWLAVSIGALGVAGMTHGVFLLQLRQAIGAQRRRLETFAGPTRE